MHITLNGKTLETTAKTAFALRQNDEVVILNGFQITEDRELKANDHVCIIHKGQMPNQDELEALMAARHTPGVHQQLKSGHVAVAGCGGLGSHVAVMLARMGVGHLLLVDFDLVEPSNLNRQHYTVAHLGQPKTQALKSQLAEINPFIEVLTKNIKVTAENALEVFANYPIVVEAFDNPTYKAELTATLLAKGDIKVVAASGLAGFASANDIQTRRRLTNLYICGDLESAAAEGMGLMAPRVAVCAGHQANMVVRLLLGLEEV
jgi:sulfur carrier protein ThiS adenylyltransferase